MNTLMVQDLVVGYRTPLFPPVSFVVPGGDILAVEGPSGSGKSTLLRTITGVDSPLSGSVFLDERDVTNVPVHKRGIAMVFQEPLLFAHLTVAENVAYGLHVQHWEQAATEHRVTELLDWLGISELAPRMPATVSGGQAQRVALARAIAPQPHSLLLDEPFSALDAPLRDRLTQDLRTLIKAEGISAIHVTHDPAEARAIGDAHLYL